MQLNVVRIMAGIRGFIIPEPVNQVPIYVRNVETSEGWLHKPIDELGSSQRVEKGHTSLET